MDESSANLGVTSAFAPRNAIDARRTPGLRGGFGIMLGSVSPLPDSVVGAQEHLGTDDATSEWCSGYAPVLAVFVWPAGDRRLR